MLSTDTETLKKITGTEDHFYLFLFRPETSNIRAGFFEADFRAYRTF